MTNPSSGGQTYGDPSGWTVDTLKEWTDNRFAMQSEKLDERYKSQTTAMETAFAAQRTAMETAFIAADKAVDRALIAQKTAMETAFFAADKAVDKALDAAEKAVRVRQDAADREFHEHLEQVRHETRTAFEASGRAIDKAETATEKRFESVNEFRAQLSDQALRFMPRAEAEASISRTVERVAEVAAVVQTMVPRAELTALTTLDQGRGDAFTARLTALEARVTRAEGMGSGRASSFSTLIAVVGGLGVLTSIIAAIVVIATRS